MPNGNMIPFELPGFAIESSEEYKDVLTIYASSTNQSACCPDCGAVSTWVHSYYVLMPHDLPSSGRPVRLNLQVKRFRCREASCQRKTFVERLPQLVALHAQQTLRLTGDLRGLAFELGGEAGARATHEVQMPVSGDTLLRILRQTNLPEVTCPAIIGLDDWALTRGRQYGTLVVDLENHRPVDLFPERTAESVAAWLQAHPGATTVSRDRAKEYKIGISQGAPQAIQIADRWHLLKNLSEAVQRILTRHPQALRQAAQAASPTANPAQPSPVESSAEEQHPAQPVLTYRQSRFAEVKARAAQGESDRTIAHQRHLDRQTVARYRHLDELPRRTAPQNTSSVTPYTSYLQQRWSEGERNVKELWRELRTQGFAGGPMCVYRAVRSLFGPHGSLRSGKPPASPGLSPRQAMWLLVKVPGKLTADEDRQRQALCQHCTDAAAVYPLAQRFGEMIRQRQVSQLDLWLKDAMACEVPALRRFAADLQQDYEAVKAALELPYSNGQLEGQINRLKYLKRQMYGRANFDLLRLRVLRPP